MITLRPYTYSPRVLAVPRSVSLNRVVPGTTWQCLVLGSGRAGPAAIKTTSFAERRKRHSRVAVQVQQQQASLATARCPGFSVDGWDSSIGGLLFPTSFSVPSWGLCCALQLAWRPLPYLDLTFVCIFLTRKTHDIMHLVLSFFLL